MIGDLERNLIGRIAIGDIFRRRALATPDEEAVVERRGNRDLRLTYLELNTNLNRFVHAVRGLGLKKGDRIGLLGPNSVEYLISLYGCAKGGFVAVPINPRLNSKDVVYILEHAEATVLVVDDALIPLAEAIRSEVPALKHFIKLSTMNEPTNHPYIDFYDFLDGCPGTEIEDVVIDDKDVFEILYTSGTTASPKGVMVTHLSVFIMSLTNLVELKLFREHVGTTLMPLFHCAQQTFTTSYLHVGGKTVIFREFNPGFMLETIQKEKIGFIFALPAMFRAMLEHPRLKDFDLSSVERCLYAMTPMGQSTLKEAIGVFGADFMLGTGQTEFFPSTNTFRPEWQLKKEGNYWGESALTVDTAVMDDDGNILPKGQIGEIVWRGPAVMKGYWKNEEATEEAWKFGWHHSGDLGYFDEDGLLVFVDRKKDMIKTGGENVSSIKVERAILKDPRVEEVAVVGLPHRQWIEAVTAFVKLAEGSQIKEEEIIGLCRNELGGFEIPKRVVFLDDLPKTATGKLQKHILRQRFSDLYMEEKRQ